MTYNQFSVPSLPRIGWKLPFNLAVLLHILILSAAIILPKYIHHTEISPEVFTVDLLSSPEPAVTPTPLPVTSKPPTEKVNQPTVETQKIEPVETKKIAPIAPPVAEEISIEPEKVVSLKPLKRKLKNKDAPELHSQQIREREDIERKKKQQQQALEDQRQDLLQEARRQQALAAAEAQAAATEAINALRHSLQANAEANSSAAANKRPTGNTSSALESQYYASIFAHLHQYWTLPDIKPWDPDLTAVVIITISQNGTIIDHRFEKRSGDRVFDQFVSKTIQDANPLPAIPGALRKQKDTLGLRFKPGGIN